MNVKKRKSSSLTCIFASGQVINYSESLFLGWVCNIYYWGLMFAISVFMAFFEPSIVTDTSLSPNASFAFWGLIVITYQLMIFISLLGLKLIYRTCRWKRVCLPLLSAPLVLALMYVGQVYIPMFEDHVLAINHPPLIHFFVYYMLEQAFQVVFVTFVFPHLPGARESKMVDSPLPFPAPQGDTNRKVVVGTREYLIDTLRYLEASEHYIRVVHEEGEDFVRARISQTLINLDDTDGVQTHRSYWLSTSYIKLARRDSGKLILQSNDGRDFTAARARRQLIERWLHDRNIPIV